jgi:hypothetical protein
VPVPPKKIPYFKPGKELKAFINGELDPEDLDDAARRYAHDGEDE